MEVEASERGKIVPNLRVKSRRDYLAKRKEDQLALIEMDILDDEKLFDEEDLTEREKKEREYKKKVLQLARDHDRAREIEKVQRYRMPEEKRGKQDFVYEEVDEKEHAPNSEQKKWEEEQMSFATLRFGAKDARKKKKEKKYEIILDDEIEFIQALKLAGTKDQKVHL